MCAQRARSSCESAATFITPKTFLSQPQKRQFKISSSCQNALYSSHATRQCWCYTGRDSRSHVFYATPESSSSHEHGGNMWEMCEREKITQKVWMCDRICANREAERAGGGEISSKLIHHQNILIWVKWPEQARKRSADWKFGKIFSNFFHLSWWNVKVFRLILPPPAPHHVEDERKVGFFLAALSLVQCGCLFRDNVVVICLRYEKSLHHPNRSFFFSQLLSRLSVHSFFSLSSRCTRSFQALWVFHFILRFFSDLFQQGAHKDSFQ